jgi:hypothetical protein
MMALVALAGSLLESPCGGLAQRLSLELFLRK